MFDEIKELMVDQLGLDANEITETTDFKKDLGIDSLDLFELVSQVEDNYGIEIPAEDLESIATVKDLIDYIEAHK
jgi:acyl carrier protein